MSDDLKNFRQAVERNDEIIIELKNIHGLLNSSFKGIANYINNETGRVVKLNYDLNYETQKINKLINNLTDCQNKQENLVLKIEYDLYNNLIENFIPEFSEKVVDKLILNELNKFEIKLDDVLKSSDILIEKSTDLQNDYIKNKDDIFSSVGRIIVTLNDTKERFEKDYERLKKDFRSASINHQNILIKYQKEINNRLENEFKKTNILKTISIVSGSIFTGMTFMYFLFPFLH